MGDPRSINMADKPKFLDNYNRSSTAIKNLLDEITNKLVTKYEFTGWGYSNKPDLRFPCLDLVFCKFELYPPDQIRLFIRVDDLEYDSVLRKLGWNDRFFVSTRGFPAGRKWIETRLYGDAQVAIILEVIDQMRTDRMKNGW